MRDNGLQRNKVGSKNSCCRGVEEATGLPQGLCVGITNEQGKVKGEDYMILDDKSTETLKELLHSSARCD